MNTQSSIFWIKGPWPGRLGIALRPRGGDWLDEEVHVWKSVGVNIVISTLESEEVEEFELDAEEASTYQAGMGFISLPIPDRNTPQENPEAVLREAEQGLRESRNVIVHCRQGIGRSALVAAALLVLAGIESEQAIQLIREARQRVVPETEEQKEWIHRFARKQGLVSQS